MLVHEVLEYKYMGCIKNSEPTLKSLSGFIKRLNVRSLLLKQVVLVRIMQNKQKNWEF